MAEPFGRIAQALQAADQAYMNDAQLLAIWICLLFQKRGNYKTEVHSVLCTKTGLVIYLAFFGQSG